MLGIVNRGVFGGWLGGKVQYYMRQENYVFRVGPV